MSKTIDAPDHQSASQKPPKLMESGAIRLSHDHMRVSIQRGMPVLSREGQEIGKVAALALDGEGSNGGFILLGRLPEIQEYRQISPDLVDKVVSGRIFLSLRYEDVERLPVWHSQ